MPNKLSQFWQELKRRNVVRVITIYAGAAFVIIELINNITEPLRLPEWTPTLVIVLLAIGFPIVMISSWIYDIHPEGGIVKTEPIENVKSEEIPASSNSWKIASYISFVVIVGLVALNIFGGKRSAKIDESLAKSIAVLPFNNLSMDPEQEPMCLGLTHEIINHLFKIESFDKVISFTTVMNYRDPERNTPEVAEELGVNYILEGTYKKIGDQLRVSAELIDAHSDSHIWQRNYDTDYEEIISLQAEIALRIAEQLGTYISGTTIELIKKIPTSNQRAYELMKQSEFQLSQYNLSAWVLDSALKAIELDPDYADAYAFVGVYLMFTGSFGGDLDIRSATLKAMPYLIKALELNPDLSSAHFGLGTLYLWSNWDYIRAEEEYLKSIHLEPNNPANISFFLEFLNKMNRPKEVLSLQKIPKINYGDLAKTHFLLGEKPETERMIRVYEDSVGKGALPFIGEIYLWMDEYELARYNLELALQYDDQTMHLPRFQACLALSYHQTNRDLQSQEILKKLINLSSASKVGSPDYWIAYYFSGISNIDSAFVYLEKAYINGSPEMPWLKSDPIWNNLKDDPRYWDLYERTGHKAYDDYMASKEK